MSIRENEFAKSIIRNSHLSMIIGFIVFSAVFQVLQNSILAKQSSIIEPLYKLIASSKNEDIKKSLPLIEMAGFTLINEVSEILTLIIVYFSPGEKDDMHEKIIISIKNQINNNKNMKRNLKIYINHLIDFLPNFVKKNQNLKINWMDVSFLSDFNPMFRCRYVFVEINILNKGIKGDNFPIIDIYSVPSLKVLLPAYKFYSAIRTNECKFLDMPLRMIVGIRKSDMPNRDMIDEVVVGVPKVHLEKLYKKRIDDRDLDKAVLNVGFDNVKFEAPNMLRNIFLESGKYYFVSQKQLVSAARNIYFTITGRTGLKVESSDYFDVARSGARERQFFGYQGVVLIIILVSPMILCVLSIITIYFMNQVRRDGFSTDVAWIYGSGVGKIVFILRIGLSLFELCLGNCVFIGFYVYFGMSDTEFVYDILNNILGFPNSRYGFTNYNNSNLLLSQTILNGFWILYILAWPVFFYTSIAIFLRKVRGISD